MARVLVPVNPKMLIWARERAGYAGIDDVLGISKANLKRWEKGEARPTVTQALMLAEKYHRSLAFFLLSTPPEEGELPDFRGAADRKKTPALQAFIHLVEARCEWAEEVRREAGKEPIGQGYINSGNIQENPEQAADHIRTALSIDLESVWSSRSPEDAMALWIQAIEDFGIFVFQNDTIRGKTIDCLQFRGLAIANPYAPAIGLNKQDAPRGKIFTLAHELTHLWLGNAGISNLFPSKMGELDRIEKYCNSVAAAMLLPTEIFRDDWETAQSQNDLKNAVAKLSGKFKVSQDAVARKAMDCRYINLDEYVNLHQEYVKAWKKWSKGKGGGGGKKGDREISLAKQAGALFSKMVISELREGDVNFTVARKLLGAKYFRQVDEIGEFHGAEK